MHFINILLPVDYIIAFSCMIRCFEVLKIKFPSTSCQMHEQNQMQFLLYFVMLIALCVYYEKCETQTYNLLKFFGSAEPCLLV